MCRQITFATDDTQKQLKCSILTETSKFISNNIPSTKQQREKQAMKGARRV